MAECVRSAAIRRSKSATSSVHALGREVEAEEFDGDELVLLRIVGSKHGAERARANLMENAERTERVRRRGAGSFRVQ